MIPLVILIVALVLAVIVAAVAAVAVGPARFVAFWIALPAQARTVINVCAGAAVAALVTFGVDAVTSLDLPAWLKVLLMAVATAFVRAINPADGAATGGYGLTSSSTPPESGSQDGPA